MKKELLMTIVAFATVGASAQVSVKKLPRTDLQKVAQLKQSSELNGMNAKIAAFQSPVAQSAKKSFKAIKKANETTVKLTPDYCEQTYRYISMNMTFLCQNMYDGASHKVGGKKAYFKPYSDIEYVLEGTVVDEPNVFTLEYGADSITFKCDEPIATYTNEKDEKVNVYLKPSEFGINSDFSGYDVFPNGSNTFGAYYLPNEDVLYIPENVVLALYAENEEKPIDDEYTMTSLYLAPQATYEKAMKRAVISAKSAIGADYDFERDSKVVFSDEYILVKGVSGVNPDAWVEFDADSEEDDGSLSFYVNEDLYLCRKNISTNDAINTYVFSTVGMKNNGLEWNFNQEEYDDNYYYPSYYSLTANEDGTYTVKNAQNTAFGEYYYTNDKDGDGLYNMYELTITIYNQAPTAIATVKDSSKQDNAMYNLAGQRINKLQRGINIVNGKKVVKK